MDISKPPSLLKTLQKDDLDVVLGLQHILRSKKSLKSLTELEPLEWPTVKLVHSRRDGNTYQGATLQDFDDRMLQSCKVQALADLKQLHTCKSMRDRLEWTYVKPLRSILVFLHTKSWQRPVTTSDDQ